jgi:hypothetical protein
MVKASSRTVLRALTCAIACILLPWQVFSQSEKSPDIMTTDIESVRTQIKGLGTDINRINTDIENKVKDWQKQEQAKLDKDLNDMKATSSDQELSDYRESHMKGIIADRATKDKEFRSLKEYDIVQKSQQKKDLEDKIVQMERDLSSEVFQLVVSGIRTDLDRDYDKQRSKILMIHIKVAQFNDEEIIIPYQLEFSSDLDLKQRNERIKAAASVLYQCRIGYKVVKTETEGMYRVVIDSAKLIDPAKGDMPLASVEGINKPSKIFPAGKLGVGGLSGKAVLAPAVAVPQPVARPALVAAAKADGPKKTTLPIVLNILPGFGLGSYIEGDLWGGLIGTGGSLLGYVFLVSGFSAEDSLPVVLWLATGAATITYGVIRPISFANKYNTANGFTSIDLMPSISATSVDGKIVAAPGAVLKLSY